MKMAKRIICVVFLGLSLLMLVSCFDEATSDYGNDDLITSELQLIIQKIKEDYCVMGGFLTIEPQDIINQPPEFSSSSSIDIIEPQYVVNQPAEINNSFINIIEMQHLDVDYCECHKCKTQ